MRISYQLATAAALVVLAVGGYFLAAQSGSGDSGQTVSSSIPLPVDVYHARAGIAEDAVELIGTARASEAVNIVPRTSGRVAEIAFREGERVTAGTTLLRLDSAAEQAELRQARAQLNDARAQYARARSLSDGRNISQAEVDSRRAAVEIAEARVEVALARLRDQEIRAPFDGVVGIREVSLGAFVNPGTALTTLDDISTIRVDFMVPERYLARVGRGQQVRITSSAFPEHRFDGEVHHIDSRLDAVTRSVRVQAAIPNPDGRLRPGMFLNVRLVLDQREHAVLIPEEALIVEGSRRYVYVTDGSNARRVNVVTGTRHAGYLEIVDGLAVGDVVVAIGAHRLSGETAAIKIRHTIDDQETAEHTARTRTDGTS